ncbi:DUF3592 domain-containing protein [Streptomyces sp. NPDC057654]|uniref:DUF3592 domain-containing protein n=1 Tax=Streptomyces sp. NPDC057654 TaxID=3346196 RepID=UPI00369C054B
MSRDTLFEILILLSLLFVITLVQHIRTCVLRRRGVRTTGTCVNHSGTDRDGKISVLMDFSIEDGQRIRFNAGYFRFPPLQVGDQTTVVYDRRRPARAEFSTGVPASGRKVRIFLAVVALAMLAVGAVCVFAY